jgi:hypothetical protein
LNIAEYGLIVRYITDHLIIHENSELKDVLSKIGDLVDKNECDPDPMFRPKVEWEEQK